MAKKVGTQKSDKKKEKKAKIADYNVKSAPADIKNDKGLLTKVPDDFDISKHKPMKKTIFADQATFIESQAVIAEQRANKLLALAKERRERVERLRKFGDEKTRKKADKLARIKKQEAILAKELEELGVDVDELMASDEE